ncbi:MAG: hypothetical protein JSS27_18910 [Planctomycetes bacterium]|nr:hypothetical protein [Planctomycetota bacterium]
MNREGSVENVDKNNSGACLGKEISVKTVRLLLIIAFVAVPAQAVWSQSVEVIAFDCSQGLINGGFWQVNSNNFSVNDVPASDGWTGNRSIIDAMGSDGTITFTNSASNATPLYISAGTLTYPADDGFGGSTDVQFIGAISVLSFDPGPPPDDPPPDDPPPDDPAPDDGSGSGSGSGWTGVIPNVLMFDWVQTLDDYAGNQLGPVVAAVVLLALAFLLVKRQWDWMRAIVWPWATATAQGFRENLQPDPISAAPAAGPSQNQAAPSWRDKMAAMRSSFQEPDEGWGD